MHVTSDGTELFVESMGAGPSILVLHGGPGMDHTYFRPDFDRLADRWYVVYLDLRGNGRSEHGDRATTIELLAADSAEVISAFGGRAIVIGHSFGGFVAQELALSHPELSSPHASSRRASPGSSRRPSCTSSPTSATSPGSRRQRSSSPCSPRS